MHKLVPADQLIKEAKDWIKTTPNSVQPWDAPDYRIPGGGPYSASGSEVFMVGNAMLRKQTYDNYLAQQYIMSCVYEGLQLDIDNALKVESRYFAKLLMQPSAKNMVRTLFMSMQDLGKGARRPAKEPATEVKTLGVLGAGLMGSGIAYVSALAGIDVVLVDTTQDKANAGKDHATKLLDYEISRGRSTPDKKAQVLARITPTADFGALKNADLIVEAVFEDRNVKAEAIKKTDATIMRELHLRLQHLDAADHRSRRKSSAAGKFHRHSFLLAGRAHGPGRDHRRQENLPARHRDRHRLRAQDQEDAHRGERLARLLHLARLHDLCERGLGDARRAYTPALIENAGRMAGMPMGPLEVMDSVGVDTALKITRETRKEVLHMDKPLPAEDFLSWMVEKNGRVGAKAAKGFYDYDAKGKRTRLWPDLFTYGGGKWKKDFGADEVMEVADEMKLRFLTIQALEAARCFEEGVVTDPRDADVGAILGWGFAPFTGGPISYIDTMGAAAFVARCDAFVKKFGPRFAPNKLLRDMAAKGDGFYTRFAPQKSAA